MDAITIHGSLGALSQAILSVTTSASVACRDDGYSVYRTRALESINAARRYLNELEAELRPQAQEAAA